MRILIVGGGDIGYLLARSLAGPHELFIIDSNLGRADRFSQLDVQFIHGSGTNPEILRRAGAESAGLFIAATRLDEVNVVACSVARELGAQETICFVSKPDLLDGEGDRDSLLRHFGIGRVVWPEAQLADAIERLIMAPGALEAVDFAGGRIQLLEFRLDEDSSLADRSVASLGLPPGVLIVAVRHDESITIPRGNFTLTAGDRVVLMGSREAMAETRQRVLPRVKQGRLLVTIIGGGGVGFRLAQHLEHASGMELCVIEQDHARGEMLAATLEDTLILHGDGTDLGFLESAAIGRNDIMVAVTDNDERNLLASLLGRQLGVGEIITRVSKPENLVLFERVGIDVTLSARGAAVTSVLHQINGGRASLLAVLDEGRAKVVELTVPDGYPPTPIKDVGLPAESVVGTVLRQGDALVPGGQDQVRGGDHLLVCCTETAVPQVRNLFGPAPS